MPNKKDPRKPKDPRNPNVIREPQKPAFVADNLILQPAQIKTIDVTSYRKVLGEKIDFEMKSSEWKVKLNQCQKKLADAEKRIAELENQLLLAKQSIKRSFDAQDLADYLNDTIDLFNKNANDKGSQYARYIINSIDFDLKAKVYKDTTNNNDDVKFSPVDISSDNPDSLSSIKINVRAIPKEE